MISVYEAVGIINQSPAWKTTQTLKLEDSLKKVLASPVISSREQPPFNRVAMDGICIDLSAGVLDSYKIEGVQAAGAPQLTLSTPVNCIEVMTGSILPAQSNCVIPYEQVNIHNGFAHIEKKELKHFQNVHAQGSDYSANEVVLKKNSIITSATSAVIASQGKKDVHVFSSPKIAIISTGSELVELGEKAEFYQIHMSNSYAIESELQSSGHLQNTRIHIQDDLIKTTEKIKNCLNQFDILILTGGVSKGKFDYVPQVLKDLGVTKHFHMIKQKPGKPMWFGSYQSKQIFALPGNPVSSLICLRRYVTPFLQKIIGIEEEKKLCILGEDIIFKKDFTLFKPVILRNNEKGESVAIPIKTNGSGDFYSLALSTGFVELPEEKSLHKQGDIVTYFPWN